MFKSGNMRWAWFALFFMLECVFALDPPSSFLKQPQPSNLPINSKNLNKPRPKTYKTANHPKTPTIGPEVTNEISEAPFPDVIYPTSILEAAQPFYFSQASNDGVLGPFSNDVKTSYKYLTSNKGKVDSLVTNGASATKLLEKDVENLIPNIVNQTIHKVNQDTELANMSLSSIHSGVEAINSIDDTELSKSPIVFAEDLDALVSNSTVDTEQEGLQLNQETPEYIFEEKNNTKDISNDSVENMQYITNIDIIHNETLSTSKEDLGENTEVMDSSIINQTVIVTPGYIITSETGNSYEEIVSEIMNIYSLIEETMRTISVVGFVVSKALNTLDIVNKQNVTTTSQIIESGVPDSFNNYSNFGNEIVNNCYDNAIDNLSINNLLQTGQLLTRENGNHTVLYDYNDYIIENLIFNNSLENSQLLMRENDDDTVFSDYDYNNFDNLTVKEFLVNSQLFTGENFDDAVICNNYDNIFDNYTVNHLFETSQPLTAENVNETVPHGKNYKKLSVNNLLETQQSVTGENGDGPVLGDYYHNTVDDLTIMNLLQNNLLLTHESGNEPSAFIYNIEPERYFPEDDSIEAVTPTCFFSDDINDCTFDNTPDENITNYNVIREVS